MEIQNFVTFGSVAGESTWGIHNTPVGSVSTYNFYLGNANQYWLFGLTGTEKNAFAKSTTEKFVVFDGIRDRMVWGLETSGVRGWTAAFTACRSWTKRHSVGWPSSMIFLTGNIGVRTGESLHGTIMPASRRDSKTGVIPSIASCFKGYFFKRGLYSDFGWTTRGLESFISPTSYFFCPNACWHLC